MFRVTVNLARKPPENLRRVRLVWGGLLAILLTGLAALATTAAVGWSGSRAVQSQIAAVHEEMQPIAATRSQAERPLHNPSVRAELDRAAFLNQLIDRKAISWTQLFEQLEKIQPPGVELVSLRPLERNGAHAVDIRFASDTLDPAIVFVQKLEASGDFADAHVERESEAALQTNRSLGATPPPRFQIEVTALYRPQPLPSAPAGATGDPK